MRINEWVFPEYHNLTVILSDKTLMLIEENDYEYNQSFIFLEEIKSVAFNFEKGSDFRLILNEDLKNRLLITKGFLKHEYYKEIFDEKTVKEINEVTESYFNEIFKCLVANLKTLKQDIL